MKTTWPKSRKDARGSRECRGSGQAPPEEKGPKSNKQNLWLKNKLKNLWRTGRIPKHLWTSVGICNFQETAWPNFLVWVVIKKEQKKPTTLSPILGDPKGRMMKLYGFRNGRSNIYVFDKNRVLRWKSSGPLSRKMGKRLIRLIRRLIRE